MEIINAFKVHNNFMSLISYCDTDNNYYVSSCISCIIYNSRDYVCSEEIIYCMNGLDLLNLNRSEYHNTKRSVIFIKSSLYHVIRLLRYDNC